MPYRAPARPQATRYLRFCVDVLTERAPCDVPWESMDGDGASRRCERCRLAVHDLTEMEPKDAEEFLLEKMDRPPKIRLYRRPDGRLMDERCWRAIGRLRIRRGALFAIGVAIGILALVVR